MRDILLLMIIVLSFTTLQAQDKNETVKHVRSMYAWAQEQMAQNGKGANPERSVEIVKRNLEDADNQVYAEDAVSMYFLPQRELQDDGSYVDRNQLFFVIQKTSVMGHYVYAEYLYEPSDGLLIFAFVRTETDGGFVIERRYYYDAGQNLIAFKSSLAYEDMKDQNGTEEVETATRFTQLFELLMLTGGTDSSESIRPLEAKAERLKSIRATYAEAKDKIAKNAKADMPNDITINIKDQKEEMPPLTEKIVMYHQHAPATGKAQCYMVTSHFDNWYLHNEAEYLIAPKTHQLLFSYQHYSEEGLDGESRYYYDDQERCFQVLTNEEQGNGSAERSKAQRYLKAFDLLMSDKF